jgi:hypothetical protein
MSTEPDCYGQPNLSQNDQESLDPVPVPAEFEKVIGDLCKDIKTSFPETSDKIATFYGENGIESQMLFDYVKKTYPERFFDILYQNNEIFEETSDINCEFLPNIDFKELWNLNDVTDNTRDTLWKYLQLLLFSSVGNITDSESFGDTAKLFEAIDQNEFKTKLEDVMSNIQNIFTEKEGFQNEDTEPEPGDGKEGVPPMPNLGEGMKGVFENMPNPEDIHSHISSMLDGKLGKLATEIAEETAGELDIDFSDATKPEDVMKKLFKSPGKLMDLVKKVGSKLDTKLKSGQIDEKELMSEASDLMRKMKDMPGMENMESMLKNMNIPGMGGGKGKGKFNMGAFENMMKQNEKRDQMKGRAEQVKVARELAKQQAAAELKVREQNYVPMTDEEIELHFESFTTGEKAEKSMRPTQNNNKKKKKKKGKK